MVWGRVRIKTIHYDKIRVRVNLVGVRVNSWRLYIGAIVTGAKKWSYIQTCHVCEPDNNIQKESSWKFTTCTCFHNIYLLQYQLISKYDFYNCDMHEWRTIQFAFCWIIEIENQEQIICARRQFSQSKSSSQGLFQSFLHNVKKSVQLRLWLELVLGLLLRLTFSVYHWSNCTNVVHSNLS